MKILIVLRKLRGGVGRANTEIANALRKKGHRVDILSREDDLKIYSLAKSIFPLRRKIIPRIIAWLFHYYFPNQSFGETIFVVFVV